MRSFDDGFTVLEMLVAAGIAVLMMSLALMALTGTTRAQRRSRMLLIEGEEARSALMRIRRDVEGLLQTTDGWTRFQLTADRLDMMCATENTGASDYARVSYYVDDADGDGEPVELVREILAWPSGTASFDFAGVGEKQIVARNVRKVTFVSDGATPPAWIKTTLSMQEAVEGLQLFEIRRYEETMNVPAGP